MKTIFAILLTLTLLLGACSAPTEQTPQTTQTPQQSTQTSTPTTPVEETVAEPAEEEITLEEEQEVDNSGARTLEPSVCESDSLPHSVKKVALDVDTEPLRRTDDGFYLKVYPQTLEGETVPVTTSISVLVYETEEYKDPKQEPYREIEGAELYRESFYRKIENVGADCAPAEVFVSFDKFNKDRLIKMRNNDPNDPGALIVKVKINAEEHQAKFYPGLRGESVMPE